MYVSMCVRDRSHTSVSLSSLRLYVRLQWMSVVKMLAYSGYSSRTSLKPLTLMYCRSQYVSAFTSAFVLITWFWLGRSEPIRSPFPAMTLQQHQWHRFHINIMFNYFWSMYNTVVVKRMFWVQYTFYSNALTKEL